MKKQRTISAHKKKAASLPRKVTLRQLPTAVRGLDEILGGGVPEYSFNIIAGAAGCGKTTLAHQIVFGNASEKCRALYFTVLGEPPLKMLRYQQQYTFFDPDKINGAIRFINLSEVMLEKKLDDVFDEIAKVVQATSPGLVVVDSFRSVVRQAMGKSSETELQSFVQRLALFLASWQATTFLVGEYSDVEMRDNLVFTIADGLFWLTQIVERNSVLRKLQIMKLRGQETVPGLHTVRITNDGLQAYSRTLGLASADVVVRPKRLQRLSTGIPELDKMMGGGIFEGDSLLVAGPAGTGKSAMATQFLADGLRHGEPGIAIVFEERPHGYVARAESLGLHFDVAQKAGKLEILYLRPLDLSVDETLHSVLDAVKRLNARRLVIDSLVGFEMALAPGFRADFRESLYRMIAGLTATGVSVLTTVEIEDSFSSFELSHYTISFLTDDIVRMRYVEIEGQLRKIIVVVKMRGGNHSKDIREYIINQSGMLIISPRRTEYAKLISGLPKRVDNNIRETAPEPKSET